MITMYITMPVKEQAQLMYEDIVKISQTSWQDWEWQVVQFSGTSCHSVTIFLDSLVIVTA